MDLGLITAVVGGLSTGLGIAWWLGKREIHRVLEVIERVPDKEWFERVEEKIDNLPSNARLEAHFEMGHRHGNVLQEHGLKIEGLQRGQADHEGRVRTLEKR